MVSCLSFCTWPEASPRKTSPGSIPNVPAMSDVLVGCASNTKTTAKMNPRGTRMRRATRDQVSALVAEGCDPDCETSLTLVLQDEIMRLVATASELRRLLRRQ